MFFRPNVEKLEQKGDVDGLVRAVEHKDPAVRDAAAFALGRLEDPRAVEPLIGVLRRRIWDVNHCWSQLTALRPLGRPDPTSERRRAIKDAEQAAGEAVSALAPFAKDGDLGAIAALLPYKGQDEKPWGATVSSVLARCRDFDLLTSALAPPDLPDVTMPSVYQGILNEGGELTTRPPTLRTWAIEELGELGDRRAVEPLVRALKDDTVRHQAAAALETLGEAAVEPLAVALSEDDAAVRMNAVQVLGRLGDARAVEPLIGALKDPDGEVGRAAAEALGRLGDQRAVEPLIVAFTSDKRGFDARSAYRALQSLGGQRAMEAITHDAPRVGDRVSVRFFEWREVGMPGDRTEVIVGAGGWGGTVVAVSPKEGTATVCYDAGEGQERDAAETTEMTLSESDASELPDEDGHWSYEIHEPPT